MFKRDSHSRWLGGTVGQKREIQFSATGGKPRKEQISAFESPPEDNKHLKMWDNMRAQGWTVIDLDLFYTPVIPHAKTEASKK